MCGFFRFCVQKRNFFLFFPSVVEMKVNIQTWGGGNNKPTLFYTGVDCCFCRLASLREPAKSSSPSIFIDWHSALRQLEVQAYSKQAREGGWVLFFLLLLPQAAEFFFSCWLTASPFQPCWGFGRWSDLKGLETSQPEVLKGHLNICHLKKLLSASRARGSVSSCCDAIVELTGSPWVGEMVTIRGCRQDPWFNNNMEIFWPSQKNFLTKIRNAKAAISWLSPARDDQKSATTRSRTHIIYNLSVYRKTHLMSCCAINVSTTGSPNSDKMLCLFFNSPLFT